ncbi:MAG: hypothetical protein ACFFDN_15245 [Candidatus Hodarchaeota archaeon]
MKFKNQKNKRYIFALLFILVFSFFIPFIFNSNSISKINLKENTPNNKLNNTNIEKIPNTNDFSVPEWTAETGYFIDKVSISDDGYYIAAGIDDGSTTIRVILYNKTAPEPMWSYDLAAASALSTVEVSGDGKYVVASTSNHGLYYFNTTNTEDPLIWSRSTGGAGAHMSSDGHYIVSNRLFSTTVVSYLYDAWANNLVWSKNFGESSWGGGSAISKDGNYIVHGTGGNVDTLYLFNNTSNNPIWEKYMGIDVGEISMSKNGDYFAVECYTNKLYLFHKDNSDPIWEYQAPDLIERLEISSDGNFIAFGCFDNNIYLFNKSKNEPMWKRNMGVEIDSLSMSAGGEYIIVALRTTGYNIYYFNRLSSNYLWRHYGDDLYRAVAVDISSNGRYCVSGVIQEDLNFYYNPYAPISMTLNSTAEGDRDNHDRDGIFDLIWTSSAGNNYSVYTNSDYFTDITEGTLIAEGLTDLNYSLSGVTNGNHYYLVASYNEFGMNTSNCINVEVKRCPKEFTLTTNAENPDVDKNFNLTWEISIGADNYSVYQSSSYINKIDGDCVELASEIEEREYEILGMPGGTYYYIVEAYNGTGATLSNCISVNVSYAPDEYETKLTLLDFVDVVVWAENMTLSINFTYTDDGGSTWKPVTDPNAYCNFSIPISETLSAVNMSRGQGQGNFTLTFNSSQLSAIGVYFLLIMGIHPVYISPCFLVHIFQVIPIQTNVSIHDYNTLEVIQDYSQYYNELINITVKYYIDETNQPIYGATLTYDFGLGPIQFYEDPFNEGYYTFTLNTSELGDGAFKSIYIFALKENYTAQNFMVLLIVLDRPTNVNFTDDLLPYLSKQIWAFDKYNFTFAYVDNISMSIIGNLDIAEYSWQEVDKDGFPVGNSGVGDLIMNLDNTYTLDFDTETKMPGFYLLILTMKKTNYQQQFFIINLEIKKIPVSINGTASNISISESILFSNAFNITFEINNTITNQRISDLDQAFYFWYSADSNGNPISDPSENFNLIKTSDDYYVLDFNTETRSVGYYLIVVCFYKINYEHRNATILLKINSTSGTYFPLDTNGNGNGGKGGSSDNNFFTLYGSILIIGIATGGGATGAIGIIYFFKKRSRKIKKLIK